MERRLQITTLVLWLVFTPVFALWPLPKVFEHGSSTLWLSANVRFVYKKTDPPYQLQNWLWNQFTLLSGFDATDNERNVLPEEILEPAFERMKHNTINQSYVPRKFYSRDSEFEPMATGSRLFIEQIVISEGPSTNLENTRFINKRETYSLRIFENGSTVIEITSPEAGLRALETLSQLFFTHSKYKSEAYTPYAPVHIVDGPAFEHRGLNLDISRNSISPKDVIRTIEALGANKLNRLHLHATDAQSWPLEIPALPDLSLKGAYDLSQIWTTKDLARVQHHGLAHGVEVFLEIDLPGHSNSIGHAYPQLITAGNAKSWSDFALEPPSGQLKLNSSDVSSFIAVLLNDILPRSSEFSSHFHVGGDELNTNAYLIDPTVNSSSSEVLQPLIQSFFDHLFSITASHSLTPIIWEDMLLDWNISLPQDIIVQTWRPSTSLDSVLAKGYKMLFGSRTHWYLDCGYGNFLDPDPQNPKSPVSPPYLDSCSPYKNWRQIYSYDPLANISPEQRHLVVGGEVHLWSELADSISLDGLLWPRVAAAAELLWSGPGNILDEATTRRLADMRERLVARGIGAGMVQMEWCLRNEGGCKI
ncbi:N-acetyl-glucosamine-6-phosphate deacetylase [Pseudocyphellaria aurata]|nr:N-acetyl-glucosamine-6-phosphate deacetylase [Pseudocyphellaria aurata]